MDLFRPKWRHSDPPVRRDAVRQLQDPLQLVEVAVHDADRDVRRAAIERPEDAEGLRAVALHDPEAGLREAALGKLSDPSILLQIAVHDALGPLADRTRRLAVAKLDDPALQARVAFEAPTRSVRLIAIQALKDDGVLPELSVVTRRTGGGTWGGRRGAPSRKSDGERPKRVLRRSPSGGRWPAASSSRRNASCNRPRRRLREPRRGASTSRPCAHDAADARRVTRTV